MRIVGGRYELGEEIGRGGMAQVHAAYDTRLGRRVAVKMLHAGRVGDKVFLARFRREAQAAAGLTHPNIVAVYDSGEDIVTTPNGEELVPYIVMELVEGRTLGQALHDDGVLPVDQALRVMDGVLAALGYSHSRGVVHRDIKPGNVMVTAGGDVKVMDFGIARGGANDATATMTQTQSVVGTAQYLSPEQARGLDVDGRSDLYSAGCLLFELVTGRPPFVGDSPLAIAYQHVGEEPTTPSDLNPDISHDLDAVIMHALIKDRDRRYQDAAAFAADIKAVRQGLPLSSDAQATEQAAFTPTQAMTTAEPEAPLVAGGAGATVVERTTTTAPPEEERKRSVWAWLLPLLLLLGLVIGGLVWWQQHREPAVVTRAVPKLIDKTEDQARAALAAAGLTGEFTHAPNAKAAGMVYGQDPAPGTQQDVKRVVAVEVSDGPSSVKVPEVRNMLQSSAKTSLQSVHLKVARVVLTDSATVPHDTVIKTDPAAGTTVPTNSGVTLYVSTGKITVVDVRGMKKDEAAQKLQKAGFSVGYEQVQSTDALPDTVLSQDPSSGTVNPGTKITLRIATTRTTASVPDVRGKSKDDATKALQDAGFAVEYKSQEDPAVAPDTVLSQDPAGGEQKLGSTVTLNLATAPAPSTPTPVPPPTRTPSPKRPTSVPTSPAPSTDTTSPSPTPDPSTDTPTPDPTPSPT